MRVDGEGGTGEEYNNYFLNNIWSTVCVMFSLTMS